jgi:hypothetical protein
MRPRELTNFVYGAKDNHLLFEKSFHLSNGEGQLTSFRSLAIFRWASPQG